jgi:hypothetical protein
LAGLGNGIVSWLPIWTEDTDFFGCGVATWTTDRVELYLLALTEGPTDE